jgi:hypothetical protein
MPVVSKKQGKFMQAVANNPKFAKKVGVNQSVGQEFTKENSMKTKKMNMGGRAMNDRDGSVAMDPKMQMAMAAQQKRAAMGGMNKGGKVKKMAMGGKVKKMRMGGNTSRQNRTEELGRVDAERADTASGRRNLSAEKSRIRGELGMNKGGKVKKMAMGGKVKGYKAGGMSDKMGRALAKDDKGMSKAKMDDAAGRAMMKKGGKVKKQGYNARLDDSLGARKGKKSQSLKSRRDESKGAKKAAGKKAYSGNRKSAQGKASKRADGIAQRGRTKGRIV